MSKLVIDALQERLNIAGDKFNEVDTKKDGEKIEVLQGMMNQFEVPEGFVLNFKTFEVGLRREGENWEVARVNLDTQRNFETYQREVSASVNANGGREVDSLLAQASFVQFVTPHLDKFSQLMNTINEKFEGQLNEIRKDCRDLESAIRDVEDGVRKEKEQGIMRQLKSKKGFDVVIVESHWGGTDFPTLELKRDYNTYNLINVKILKTTASGKSADLEITEQMYDGTPRTRKEERVRMSNVNRFIKGQLYRLEKIEEGELKVVETETEKA